MEVGQLLLAATPLGCVEDASFRLVSALTTADIIAAEDTRRLYGLTRKLSVSPTGRIISLFDANEATRVPGLINDIASGATVLVVSDAGMPLISDPGYRLVTECVAAGLPVGCLPGPSAVTTALAVSGLPSDRFCFEGFAPRRSHARQAWLSGFIGEQRTIVFFESPRRLQQCLLEAVQILTPTRQAVICRELTKVHEEIIRGTLEELAHWASSEVLGEITVVLAGHQSVVDTTQLVSQVNKLIETGYGIKEACTQVIAHTRGEVSRRDLYNAVLEQRWRY